MNYTEIRKLSLKCFVGFLVLTALIAIISVLSGDSGMLQVKIMATSATISTASICLMSCAAFIEKKKLAKLGLLGIFLSISAAILLIIGIWTETGSKEYWKTTISFVVFAIAFAHTFLLLLPRLDNKQKWVQSASTVSIGILALMTVAAAWGDIDDEGYYRVLAVAAIIVGFETLVIPILMKLRKENSQETKLLILESIGNEIYKDSAGTLYNVKKINTGQEAPADADKQCR